MAIQSIFRKGHLGYVGLDVSTDSVSAVQLEGVPGGKNYHVVGWGRVALPVGVVSEGRILNKEKFQLAIQKLFKEPKSGRLDGKQLILSLAEHQCYHNSFSIKKIGQAESFYSASYNNLSQSIPLDINEVQWDWELILEEIKFYRIYSVAVPKEVVEEYRAAFKSVNMIIPVIEPQVISASRLFFEQQSVPEPVVYLEVGGEEVAISTIDQFGVHQSSIVEFGINTIISNLAKSLKVEKKVAKKVLHSIGLRSVKHPKAEMIKAIIVKGLDSMIREISQHKTYYQYLHENTEVPLQSIMINGEGAIIPGLAEYLAKATDLQIRQGQSWAKFDPALSGQQVLLLHNALGAAMRGVHTNESRDKGVNVLLVRKEDRQKKKRWWGGSGKKKAKKKKKTKTKK